MKLIVSKEAAADLTRLRDFLMDRNPSAAQRAVAAIANAVRSLDLFPQRGRQSGAADMRELVVPFGRSAYIVWYAILTEADEIVILQLWGRDRERGRSTASVL